MKLITALFILFSTTVSAQKDFVWTEVVKVDSTLSAKELYSRAKLYIAKTYVSNKAVTQLNDDEALTIVIKPVHEITPKYQNGLTGIDAGYVRYSLTVVAKDGRYKYTIDQCSHEGIGKIVDCGSLSNDKPAKGVWVGGLPDKFWNEKLKPDFIASINSLIAELKTTMAKKSDKADW